MENNEKPTYENSQQPGQSVTPQQINPTPPSPLYSAPAPVPLTQPPFAPAVQPVQPAAAAAQSASNPGLIVLQWLTYAFWGWTVLAMSLLTGLVMANFFSGFDDGSFTPYAIAAVLVLLPISVTCDVFYSKQEPEKKTGAASIVMVIHAVIFAIFGIGALIAIVFSLVQLFTSSSDTANVHAALVTELIITILYALVFLRTLNPAKLTRYRKLFPIIMVGTVGVISVLAFIGPVAHAHATKNDRLIDDNLYSIQSSVDEYVNNHQQLPSTLGSLGLYGDAKKLIDSNSVQYIANSKPAAISDTTYSNSVDNGSAGSSSSTGASIVVLPKTYYYELCVNYKKSAGNSSNYQSSSNSSGNTDNDGYSDAISTADHPAGKYCYKGSSTPIN